MTTTAPVISPQPPTLQTISPSGVTAGGLVAALLLVAAIVIVLVSLSVARADTAGGGSPSTFDGPPSSLEHLSVDPAGGRAD